MSADAQPTFLFASQNTDLLAAIEPTLLAAGARVDIVLSAHAALLCGLGRWRQDVGGAAGGR